MELSKVNTDEFFLNLKKMKRVYQFEINNHLVVVGAKSYCKFCTRRYPKNYRWMCAVIAQTDFEKCTAKIRI